jgi:GT2 family glycosyltransferase
VSNPKVTIGIFNFHGRNQLESCLNHLAGQDFPDWELVLIDNSPHDGLLQELKAKEPLNGWLQQGRAKLIVNDRNVGFAKAANRVISDAQGEYILLLNQDVFMEPSYIGTLVGILDGDQQVASVTGKLLKVKSTDGPDIIDTTGHELYDDRVVINRGKDEEDKGQYENEEEVFGVSAAAAMYRLSALKEIAYEGEVFDEDFFAYLEDIDIDFRLRRAGYKAWYTPKAVARHALAGSGGRRSFSIRFRAHTNRYKVIWKNDSFPLLMRDFLPLFRQEALQFFRTLFTSPLLLCSFFILPFKIPRIYHHKRFINQTAKVSFDDIYYKWGKKERIHQKTRVI